MRQLLMSPAVAGMVFDAKHEIWKHRLESSFGVPEVAAALQSLYICGMAKMAIHVARASSPCMGGASGPTLGLAGHSQAAALQQAFKFS